jgi:hypothetical protein
MIRILFVLTSIAAISTASYAQSETSKEAPQDAGDRGSLFYIRYGYRAWNKNPLQIDASSVLMRDKNSGKLVQIRLQETEPDSSVFSGTFVIQWDQGTRVSTEFYIPPQNLLEQKEGFRELQRIIKAGELTPKPYIHRVGELGDNVIEIFDTRDQASEAQAIFEEEMRLRELGGNANLLRRSGEGLETVSLDENLLKSALTLDEQKALGRSRAQVLRQEQLERQSRIERLSAFRALPQTKRKVQMDQGKKLAAEGMKAFSADQVTVAASKFEQSRNLDPGSAEYDFQYGAALYRMEKYVQSLAILKMVDPAKVPTNELRFYLGLNYYQIQDLLRSKENFQQILDSNDKALGPSSAFYIGLIDLKLKNTDAAKKQFEYVMEYSSDERLIERSKEYLQYADRIAAFEREKAKKWTWSGALGAMYDSNVLLTSDSSRDQGLASDAEALRSLVQLQASYRPHFTEKTEWRTELGFLNLKSVTPALESDDQLERTDPTIITFRAPYSITGKWGERSTKWQLSPGYEHIMMDLDGTGTTGILNSALMDLSTTVVMRDNWVSSYHLNLRYDDSSVPVTDPSNNSDAFKAEIKYSNIYFTNPAKGRILLPEVGYVYNAAEGDAQVYYRINLSLAYIFPWIFKANWSLQSSYYVATYPDGNTDSNGLTSSRSEQNGLLGVGFSKPLGKNWSWMLHTSFTKNNASDPNYTYTKFNVLTSFGFSY